MTEEIKFDAQLPVPRHVAIIMDGNGRWAQARGLERTAGHREGLNAIRRVAVAASDIGVKIMTVYAFSTENWKRPKSEIAYLMKLPGLLEAELIPDLMKNNVKVAIMGEREGIPKYTLRSIQSAIKKTEKNTGLVLNIAFNYGSRKEITDAVRDIARDVKEGKLPEKEITEELISSRLKTAPLGVLADPDFLIRSSGEVRLSNYLLWQLAYAELYFTETKWPDFDEEVFLSCIAVYQKRRRRYGGLENK